MVSASLDGERVLLGEVKWSATPFDVRTLRSALRELAGRPAPPLPSRLAAAQQIRALFVPETAGRRNATEPGQEPLVIPAADLLDGGAG